MIKNIKSIITSGKQLTLLSLILLSGGGMAYAQDTSVPDTVYVSFAAPDALKTPMTYGTSCAGYVEKLPLQSNTLTFVWAAANNTEHESMKEGQNIFKTGKAFKDILQFASLPTVTAGGKLLLDEAALQDAFTCLDAPEGSAYTANDVVYKVSQSNGAVLERAFTVTKASLTVTAKPITCVYGDPNPPLTSENFTFDGFKGNDSEAIFDGSTDNVLPTVTFGEAKNVGEHSLVVSGGKAANYNLIVNTPVKFTITQAPLTLTLPELTRRYDDELIKAVSAGNIKAEGLKNGEKLIELIEDLWTITDPGKKDVGDYSYPFSDDAKEALNKKLTNYKCLFSEGKFKITKDEITITVFPADAEVKGEKVMQKIYGEKNPDGYFWLKKRTEAGSAPSFAFSQAGSQGVKDYIGALGAKGFTTLPVAGYFDYEKKPVTEKTDVNLKKLSAPAEDSLYVATVANKTEIASTNYTFKVVDGSLLINQRPLKFQKVVVDRIYGETKQDTTWTFEATDADKKRGLASFDAAYRVSTNAKAFELIDVMPQLIIKKQAADSTLWAGSYIDTLQIKLVTTNDLVTPKFKAADRNYKITFPLLSAGAQTNDSIRLEVAKANLKIKLGTIKRTFGSAVPDFNDAEIQKEFITYTGFKLDESANNLDSATVDAGGNRIKNLTVNNPNSSGVFSVAVYELTGIQEVNKRNQNYAITIEGKALYEVIPDNSLVLEWNPLTIDLIKGDKIKLDAKVKKEQGVIAKGAQIDFVSSDPTKIRIEKVGTDCYLSAEALTDNEGVTITASYHGLSGYEEVKKSVVYKVVRLKNEADYNIVLGDMSFVYDGTTKEADVKVTDLEGLETYPHYVTYNGDTDLPVNAGIYNVSIYVKQGSGKSDLLVRKEKMQIKAGEVVVTPDDATIVYGSTIPESFTYTVSGFIGNDVFKVGKEPKVKVGGEITGVGEYTLYVEGGDPGDNYTLVTKSGLLTVTKTGLTIKADTIRIVYGEEIPEYTFTITAPDGTSVDPEKLNDVYKVITKVEPKDAGVYDLIIDRVGVSEDNFDVALVHAKLFIDKADADLAWDIKKTTLAGGDTLQLTAEAASPAEISYAMQYDTIATVKKNDEGALIIGKGQGVTKLYISIPEEKNYLAANDSVTFNVTSTVANESIVLQGVKLYPTLVETNATVVSSMPVAMIRVFNAGGSLVKQIVRPDQTIDLSSLSGGYHLVQIVLENGEAKVVPVMKK